MFGMDGFLARGLASVAVGQNSRAADGFTVLASVGDNAFLERLFAEDDNARVAFAAQAYDCAVILALTSQAMESARAATLMLAVQDVTAGGRTCTTYADCIEKLQAGEDIDYDGPSGKLAINADGDPTLARFTAATINRGRLGELATIDVDIAQIGRHQEVAATAAFTTKLQIALRYLGFLREIPTASTGPS